MLNPVEQLCFVGTILLVFCFVVATCWRWQPVMAHGATAAYRSISLLGELAVFAAAAAAAAVQQGSGFQGLISEHCLPCALQGQGCYPWRLVD